ncbi:uncharacterized protein [Bos indicus]|uniref:Uncharacterized protein isoform X6 n=1 Tax=Bos indicus TaxID=9915 RepID=A0ABM4SHJ2_BOSIN
MSWEQFCPRSTRRTPAIHGVHGRIYSFLPRLNRAGVVKDQEMAMHWFRRASQQNHPHGSFNLAVGKLKNITGSMEVGDIEMLLHVAARQGIQEAQELLENIIWTKSKPLPTKRVGSFL